MESGAGKKGQMLRLLFWETTIKCNLTCAHCRRVETNEAVESDMSTEDGRRLIEQLAELGRGQGFMPILVFSGGEPLCREDLFELIEYAVSLGVKPALATNGTLIDSDVARRVKASGVERVSVSLDGATSEVHNKLRQLEGSFEDALAGIGKLREEGVEFQINVTLTKHNADQLYDIFELAKNIGAVAVHVFMLVPVGCGEEFAQEDMLSSEEYEEMLGKIADIEKKDELQIKVTCGPHYERVRREMGVSKKGHGGGGHPGNMATTKGCLAGLGVLFVGHQGDVFPCGYLPVNCGNVLKENLADIWYENADLARMRKVSELEGKCGACGYKHVCGGCRARAYSASGNYMAQEPFCGYVPPKDM